MSLIERALRVIPSGVQTFSKSRGQWPANAPTHILRGRGSHVWDDEDREFIDFTLGLGPIVLGYQDPDVETMVADALAQGPIFSMPHPLEVTVSEMLTEVIPCAEMVKFGLSGSDVTTAAIRAARAYTGRPIVVSQGYHGWHEWACPNRTGVIDDVWTIRTSDWSKEAKLWSESIAAIIVEPEYVDDLPALRRRCDEHRIVLIFDEVLTGFRVALGGYQQYCGVAPDLATFSKAMGNGYPISAVVGKRKIMRTFEKIGYSGTFLGSTPGLAATGAVIRKMRSEPVIARLWENGTTIKSAFTELAKDAGIEAELVGLPPRSVFRFNGDIDADPIMGQPPRLPWRTLFAQELIAHGILANFGFTQCYAHSDFDIDRAIEAMGAAFEVLASVDKPEERLIGDPAGVGVRAA